jgi:hypothetical protein
MIHFRVPRRPPTSEAPYFESAGRVFESPRARQENQWVSAMIASPFFVFANLLLTSCKRQLEIDTDSLDIPKSRCTPGTW